MPAWGRTPGGNLYRAASSRPWRCCGWAVTLAAASSGRPGTFVRPRRPRGRHDLPGERARAGDHDKLPAGGADREGTGITLLENAQDVGDLLAAIRAGPAPADNDPLTDIGRCEPDREPAAHAGHLFRGPAPRAATGLATTPLPAGDVAGGVAGVIRQRAGPGGAAGRAGRAGEPGVPGGEPGPPAGYVVFAEDRLHRADRPQAPPPAHSPGRLRGIGSPWRIQPAGHSPVQFLPVTSMPGPAIR